MVGIRAVILVASFKLGEAHVDSIDIVTPDQVKPHLESTHLRVSAFKPSAQKNDLDWKFTEGERVLEVVSVDGKTLFECMRKPRIAIISWDHFTSKPKFLTQSKPIKNPLKSTCPNQN